MTKDERMLLDYARRQQEALGLSGWSLEFHWHEADRVHSSCMPDGSSPFGALTNCIYNLRHAEVHVGIMRPQLQVRETITHELLHCLLTEMEIAFRYAINGLGAEAQQIALDHWNDAEELAVARLAAALCDDGEGQ